MINVNSDINFFVGIKHSDKKNKDYYCLLCKVGDEEIVVSFISKSLYEKISSTLK